MRLIAVLTASLLPVSATPLPAGPALVRQVSSTGTVWINATALPSGSSLYNGDTLATAGNGFAVITCAERGRIEVRQDSLVSVGRQEITLQSGVVGSDGTAVRIGNVLVRPSNDSASRPWFVVAARDGRKLVASYEGDVMIVRRGEDPILVPQGSLAVPVPADAPAANEDTAGQRAGSPVPTGADSGWTIFSLSSAASVALVVTLGATAVVSTIVGYTLAERSLSPSN